MAQMEQIRVNDGSKTYQIVNQNDEELGVFRFNPTDMGMLEKYNDVVERISKVLQGLEEGGTETPVLPGTEGEEGTPADAGENPAAAVSLLSRRTKEAMDEIKAAVDELFGYDTGSFWAVCSPLTPLSNGQFFIENVMDAVAQVIEKEMGQRAKKVQSKMRAYTDKYRRK